MDERDRAALEEMRQYARQAIAWAREAGAGWANDAKTVAAVAHMVGQIGEAARRISVTTKAAHADIPWAAMAGMRNRIYDRGAERSEAAARRGGAARRRSYHDYGGIDVAVLVETVRRDLPTLLKQLAAFG